MMQKLTCSIPSSAISYEIEIQSGLLKNPLPYLATLASRFAIIADDCIPALYGEQLQSSLQAAGCEVHQFTFPSGEHFKTRHTKELLENQLFEKGLGRDTCALALGGGAVTDMAGYLAATYCRGIPLVMIPTTLLGMVDASIGGKNGVNVPYGKNLLGCIYQPKKVFIDPVTLHSLPLKELANGVVEMIKHALIADSAYFEYLEGHSGQLLALEQTVVEKAIFESCRIKKTIVEQDERENGKRHLLNFGHTVGHALENLTHYALSHGEAVAIGLLVESHLAWQLGKLSMSSFERLHHILNKYGIPLRLPCRFSLEALLNAMRLDKKSIAGQPRFVIIEEIGSPLCYSSSYCMHVAPLLLQRAVEWMNDSFS